MLYGQVDSGQRCSINRISVQYRMTATDYLFASNQRPLHMFDFLSSPSSLHGHGGGGRTYWFEVQNFSEEKYVDNGSLITPSKFDARFLKASQSKFYWYGSFEELIDFAVKYLNVKRDTAKLSVRK